MAVVDPQAVKIFDWNEANRIAESTASRNGSPAIGLGTRPNFADVAAGLANEAKPNPTGSAAATSSSSPFKFWEKENLSFGDFVDIINPLQHIPIVATLYRKWTGDQIGAAPRIIGGALWGRVGGLVTGVANAFIEWFTGKDIGDHIYSALFGSTQDVKQAQAQRKPENLMTDNPLNPPGTAQRQKNIERAQAKSTTEDMSVPWPAASALHIFQRHDRWSGEYERSIEPVLHYIA